MKTFCSCLVLCALLITTAGMCSASESRTAEISSLIEDFNSTNITQRINAAKIVTRSGFESNELYATIESLLRKGYSTAKSSKSIDEMSWLCKALAASGDYNYSELFNEVANETNSTKLKKYASQSADRLNEYAQRKEVMNDKASWNTNLTDEENRLINMLSSGDLALIKDAAKIIYRSSTMDITVYDATEKQILTMLPSLENSPQSDTEAWSNAQQSDTIAWLCKALSTSGNKKYIPTLKLVVSSARTNVLKNHARKALNNL